MKSSNAATQHCVLVGMQPCCCLACGVPIQVLTADTATTIRQPRTRQTVLQWWAIAPRSKGRGGGRGPADRISVNIFVWEKTSSMWPAHTRTHVSPLMLHTHTSPMRPAATAACTLPKTHPMAHSDEVAKNRRAASPRGQLAAPIQRQQLLFQHKQHQTRPAKRNTTSVNSAHMLNYDPAKYLCKSHPKTLGKARVRSNANGRNDRCATLHTTSATCRPCNGMLCADEGLLEAPPPCLARMVCQHCPLPKHERGRRCSPANSHKPKWPPSFEAPSLTDAPALKACDVNARKHATAMLKLAEQARGNVEKLPQHPREARTPT